MEGGERKVLQLPFDLLDAQPMGQWCVDVKSLLSGPTLLVLGHDRQGPHVVEPICKLDQQYAPI